MQQNLHDEIISESL